MLAVVALDVASPRDNELAQQHLARCAECTALFDEFRAVAALVGAAVKQAEPPADLRNRILARARTERKRVCRFAAKGWLTKLGLVAASLVALVPLVWAVQLEQQATALRAEVAAASERAADFDHVATVLSSEHLVARALRADSDGVSAHGMVFLDPGSGTGIVTVRDLPALPPDRSWQLWFLRTDGKRISGGVLDSDALGDGYAFITVPQDLASVESVDLTEEPTNGSAWPTSPRLLEARLRENQ